ncbi:hypothetical protein DEU38_1254 [Rhodococcus sp. AG1013]|nr:hypothetical protein DEU38_1254 [Rhodococcus sp. AG1013]
MIPDYLNKMIFWMANNFTLMGIGSNAIKNK